MGALAFARPASPRRPVLADAGLAIVLAAVALIETAVSSPPAPVWPPIVAVLLATMPLAWRESAPLLVVVVAAAGVVLASVFGNSQWPLKPTLTGPSRPLRRWGPNPSPLLPLVRFSDLPVHCGKRRSANPPHRPRRLPVPSRARPSPV